MLNTEELELLKKKLPRGYSAMISVRAQVNPKTVYNFFRGQYNTAVHAAALAVGEEYQRELKQLNERTKALTG